MRPLFTPISLLLALVAASSANAQHHGRGHGPMMMGARAGGGAHAEMQVIQQLLASHEQIQRTVTNLPDGIRTVTESDDPAVAELLQRHVLSLEQRLREPGELNLPMQTEALRAIFSDRDAVTSRVERTPKGIAVVQTSGNPATAAALQEHAAEVSAMVADGMAAVHAAMQKSGGMMGRGMGRGMVMRRGGMMGGMRGDSARGP